MEWDSFWALNKKPYEATSPRYMGVFEETAVTVNIRNGPTTPSGLLVQIHTKKPEMGKR